MKRSFLHSRPSRSRGFTLIELLVVMGIIAILAGVLFPVAVSAINAAKRAKASATVNQIQTSVLAYYTEYSVYPVPTTLATGTDWEVNDGAADANNWTGLLYALSGNVNPYNASASPTPTVTISNTRAIPFLSMKSSDCFTTGVAGPPKNPLPTSATANIYYNIAMDSDYNGVLGDSTSAITMPNFATSTSGSVTMTGGTSTAGVAVWGNCNGGSTTNPNFYVKTY